MKRFQGIVLSIFTSFSFAFVLSYFYQPTSWFLIIEAELLPSEFAKLRALRAFMPYVPLCLTRLTRALIFTCLNSLIMRFARLICYLRALLTRNIKSLIKGNFKYIYIYIYTYIYIYKHITLYQRKYKRSEIAVLTNVHTHLYT